MTQLEWAQELLGYDPVKTPQHELENATRSVQEAEIQYESDRKTLAELDDDAIYEWRCEDQICRILKREIVKRTLKQIRLAPKSKGEKQQYLSRQQLGAGQHVPIGYGWWLPKYVFGWVVRPNIEEQVIKNAQSLEVCRARLRRAKDAIANGEMLVDPAKQEMLDLAVLLAETDQQKATQPANWQSEGF